MIIGVSLNEVIRDFRGQFEKMYNKYHPQDEETEPKEIDKTKFNLLDNFYFSGGTEELNKFLYFDSSLEIFGHANELHTNIITHLNQFHNDMEDEGHTIMLISKELANSKPSTLFFLSKTTCKVNTIKFVRKSEDKWNHVDIMITADPDVLNSKPSNKKSIKITTDYNKNCNSDFTINNLKTILSDRELLNKIINTTTINYTEIQ
jgi:hypothetical protein